MLAAGVMHGESAFAGAAVGGGGRIAERGKEDKDEGSKKDQAAKPSNRD